jgi:hypothetical protein
MSLGSLFVKLLRRGLTGRAPGCLYENGLSVTPASRVKSAGHAPYSFFVNDTARLVGPQMPESRRLTMKVERRGASPVQTKAVCPDHRLC